MLPRSSTTALIARTLEELDLRPSFGSIAPVRAYLDRRGLKLRNDALTTAMKALETHA
jgi:hypothetical protein